MASKRNKHRKQSQVFKLKPVTAFMRTALPAGIMFGLVTNSYAEVLPDFQSNNSTIARDTSGNNATINSPTARGLGSTSSIAIATDQSVTIQQQQTAHYLLNSTQSGLNPEQILGKLNSAGSVTLYSANGILIGPTAQINVNSLVATGLKPDEDKFLQGKHSYFNQDGSEGGIVVNQGLIQAATGGSVNLIGSAVRNEGTILATAGQVNLVAGKKVTMDFDGDGLIQFTVDQEVLQNVHDLDDAVSNTGTINAEGGSVLLHGSAAKDVFTNVVNNSGMIGANKISNEGGVIKLVASGSSNSLINTGTLNASSDSGDGGTIEIYASDTAIISEDALITATSSSDNGGKVTIEGDKVGLFGNTIIDASGETGGGEVLVGGGFQGNNPDIQNASFTTITGDASIKADAVTNGDAGKVIVWSDNTTRFYGDISAEGGSASGDGGFVEVSGKNHLAYRGTVSTKAANGKTGTLLLDPTDITIQAGGITDIESTIAAGTETFAETTPTNTSILTTGDLVTALGSNNVVVTTVSGAAGNGDITVADDITYTGGTNRTLSLQAENTITLSANANITSSTTALEVTLAADTDASGAGAIVMNTGSSIESNGGNILLGGGDTVASGSARGEATNIAGVSLTDATLDAAGGNITIRGQGFTDAGGFNHGVSLTSAGTGSSVTTTGTGTITIDGTGGNAAGANNSGVNISGSGTTVSTVDGLIDSSCSVF
ncbi:MAG: filamentous hemagglutinin N-terminal domain-containing protein [Pseudomonadota bacterium]